MDALKDYAFLIVFDSKEETGCCCIDAHFQKKQLQRLNWFKEHRGWTQRNDKRLSLTVIDATEQIEMGKEKT